MKTKILLFVILGHYSLLAQAQESTAAEIRPSADYKQVLSIQAGNLQPETLNIQNGSSTFRYDPVTTQSTLVEAGWSLRLFRFLGTFELSENLAYTQIQGTALRAAAPGQSASTENLTLNLMGLDTRFVYNMDWFPVRWMVPFVEGGYFAAYYSQTGSSDLESVQGSMGNAVAGAGLKFWLNAWAEPSHLPLFLSLKWNRNFAATTDISFNSDTFMAGIGVGL